MPCQSPPVLEFGLFPLRPLWRARASGGGGGAAESVIVPVVATWNRTFDRLRPASPRRRPHRAGTTHQDYPDSIQPHCSMRHL